MGWCRGEKIDLLVQDYCGEGKGEKEKVKLGEQRVKTLYFQETENIKVTDKQEIINNQELLEYKQKLENEFKMITIILRASGTEPKIRVMVEGKNKNTVIWVKNLLVEKIKMIK